MNSSIRFDWSPHRALYDEVQFDAPAPLEQAWSYGEALAAASRNSVRRAVVEIEGRPVATLQVAERRWMAEPVFARLTRGPVAADPGTIVRIAPEVAATWRKRCGRFLFWMPDVPEDAAPALLRPLGKRPMTTGYATTWLDMAPEPEQLRRNLRGNWRNHLRQAETDPPVLRLSRRTRDIEPFIAAYLRERRRLRYGGPSGGFVRTLAAAFARDACLFRALEQGEPLAESLFLRHGRSATYFLSWTSEEGRRRNAAHLLLWEAIATFREDGVRWLDIGGLDARAPGVAAFKLGLGCAPATFSGTWF